MRNRKWKSITAVVMAVSMLCGCAGLPVGRGESTDVSDTAAEAGAPDSTEKADIKGTDTEGADREGTEQVSAGLVGGRPLLLNAVAGPDEGIAEASVARYQPASDLSNVENLWQYYLGDGEKDKLARNGFVVYGGAGSEFFQIYEANRYDQRPNFVTVDSMMHIYHLYFSYLLKNIERDYLADCVLQLSRRMLEDSTAQYERLAGSEWESAAARNIAFFTVGAKLLDESTAVNGAVADMVQYELENIGQAGGVCDSVITGKMEDYSQYKPRGYYEGDAGLEAYFRAMMWYGRIHFEQDAGELDRSAVLITNALDRDAEAYRLWEAVYAVTSFFAGASDDFGVCEYASVIREAYGENAQPDDLIGNAEGFLKYCYLLQELPSPEINSLPVAEGDDNVLRGFRFMGQRFTIDAAVMQKLIYSNVGEDSEGRKRMLPDVLDVPAALGSETALRILEKNGETGYKDYSENMNKLRTGLKEAGDLLWSASLYAGWLNTLRPLLEEKGEGYPVFMQTEEWRKKNLECFAGSFTELKHDTVLYSKQVMAEMGGGPEEEPDDRGYVEPEPLVYKRFRDLAEMTVQGLKRYEMVSSADEENLLRLSMLADRLCVMAEKELREETLTEEEYDLIRNYGGNIEHFWRDVIRGESGSECITVEEYPAALVVDIATDPTGWVLEAATGSPSVIYVVVNVDGCLKIASGSVYTFYQFVQPMSDRLTDSQWRLMMGLQADEDGYYNYDSRITQPEWTDSYRYRYEWE